MILKILTLRRQCDLPVGEMIIFTGRLSHDSLS